MYKVLVLSEAVVRVGVGRETRTQGTAQDKLEECREGARRGQKRGTKYSCGPTLCQNFLDAVMYDTSE